MTVPLKKSGLIIGKFMPPHAGHQLLVDFARAYVNDLTVMVLSREFYEIPGDVRVAWMREMFPGVRVLHNDDPNPQEPHEHPEFWRIWRESIRRLYPTGPDFVFASEKYGMRLARELCSTFIPVDVTRDQLPVSGTAIRENPMLHWDALPACVRPYFVRRVCVFGPESTGKTTLAADLARHFSTDWVAEYARGFLDQNEKRGVGTLEDIDPIARGQIASEEALARQANRVLICDTNLITTTIWSDVLFGDCPQWVRDEANRRAPKYDVYLLTDIDVEWIDDPQRCQPDPKDREAFMRRCEWELESRGLNVVRVRGSWDERFDIARRAVEEVLARKNHR